ncbi:MAG TPA: hypothetical protein VFB72_10315 [Verrucomicrobiae bacterium]|nr:hypothetical protein [Verrucomicrobiae bacterium]
MKGPGANPSKNSPESTVPQDGGFSPWKRLKGKRISYLTLPLLFMATVTEFVILCTGWKYQKVVCLPQGMGVTFFGIGPIGATILAVELLKLPMAIWTASRHGWQKVAMVAVGLPCICLLTFQLVKDMAVYEMGVALAPATQMLEKASAEDAKIAQLNSELAAIQEKKSDHQKRIEDLIAKQNKAKADLEESMKYNEDVRHDAVSLTDYQRKELADVDNRESAIIVQFNTESSQIQKTIADLRAAREAEVERAVRWNAEQARIDNDYQTKLADYKNRKAQYDKEKAAYDNAGVLKRQLMREPVSPGVPPEREANRILKPTPISEFDTQISAAEAELQAVNNKRRDRIAQVEAEAKSIREQFDKRSVSKREEADKKRDELHAAEAALAAEYKNDRKLLDQDLTASVQKVDGIRAQLAICQKNANEYYEAREAAIRKTQVHRIATTVEIVRAMIKGERPMTIKMSAKERGDILTDQISMVRIWVYPVLAFIVAFLPTLMVEIGFSTIFHPDDQRPEHRLGFFGSNLYHVMVRAGRQKILRAERIAREAQATTAARDRALTCIKQDLDKTATEKDLELIMIRESLAMAQSGHEDQMKQKAAEHEQQLKEKDTLQAEQLRQLDAQHAEKLRKKTEEWEAKHATLSDSLNEAKMEADELRNTQKAEIERQVQIRQTAFSERLAALQKELGEARAAAETERAALLEEHHKKQSVASENAKNQINQLRRQLSDVQLAAEEKSARLAEQLNEVTFARDTAEARLKDETAALSAKITQAREDAAREIDKAARQEKARNEKQQADFEKKTRQLEEALELRLKQREKDLAFEFENRLTAEKNKLEEDIRLREAELIRQTASRAQETVASRDTEIRKREEVLEARFKQREQQLQTQAEDRIKAIEAKAEERFRDRETEFQHQLESQTRSAELRLRDELRKKDEQLQAKIKEREQEWSARTEARTAELLKQQERELQLQAGIREDEIRAAADEQFKKYQEESERRLEAQTLAAETRLREELKKKDERLEVRLKEREQELNAKAEASVADSRKQLLAEVSAREEDLERRSKSRIAAAEARVAEEAKHNEELFNGKLRQRDQQWQAKLDALQLESKAEIEEALRRRGLEADAALRALETQLREEMQQKEMAAQTRTAQREQEAIAQSRALWEAEAEAKTFQAMESFRALLTRTEMERDEARQGAMEANRRMENLQKKLSEASSFFSSWRNGNNVSEPV